MPHAVTGNCGRDEHASYGSRYNCLCLLFGSERNFRNANPVDERSIHACCSVERRDRVTQTQTQISADFIAAISTSTSQATNLNPGSLIRSLSDAFSAESALMEAEIESQVATGIINAVYQLLPITQNGAVGSTYLLTFTLASSAPSNVTLASGTAVTIPNSSLQWQI